MRIPISIAGSIASREEKKSDDADKGCVGSILSLETEGDSRREDCS